MKKECIVYFANWNLEKKEAKRGGEVAGIPWDKVTYINHAFWEVAPADGTTETTFERRASGLAPRTEFAIQSMRPEYDLKDLTPSALIPALPRNHFTQYAAFSKRYPKVTIMLSIGGWARCGYFSEMAYTAEGRASFIRSCVELIARYSWIGGIDIDWEYPACTTAGERAADPSDPDGDQGCPIWGTPAADNANFAALLRELREALDEAFGKENKKLTACAGASVSTTLPCQDWAQAAPYLDMINLMTYDLAGVWDGHTGHATGLGGTKAAVEYLEKCGIPSQKMCIGAPFYGIAFLREPATQEGGDETTSPIGAPALPRKATTREITITECTAFRQNAKEGWIYGFDQKESAAYLYNDNASSDYFNWFISYESPESLDAKLSYILEHNLAGIIIWECSQDTADHMMLSRIAQRLL